MESFAERDAMIFLQRMQENSLIELSSARVAGQLASAMVDLFEQSDDVTGSQLAARLAEWLLERPEVAEVYGSDAQLLDALTETVEQLRHEAPGEEPT